MTANLNARSHEGKSIPVVSGRVVGIDPGLGVTGYAVVDPKGRGAFVVEAGVIRSRSAGDDLGKRLEVIHAGVLEVPPGWARFPSGMTRTVWLYRCHAGANAARRALPRRVRLVGLARQP